MQYGFELLLYEASQRFALPALGLGRRSRPARKNAKACETA